MAQWQEKYRLAIKHFVFYLHRLDPSNSVDLKLKIRAWGAVSQNNLPLSLLPSQSKNSDLNSFLGFFPACRPILLKGGHPPHHRCPSPSQPLSPLTITT
jgi:hypothetical protein